MIRHSLAIGLSIAAMGATYPFLSVELSRAGVTGWWLLAAMVATPTMRLIFGSGWGALSDKKRGAAWVLALAAAISAVGAGMMSLGVIVLGVFAFAIGRVGIDPLLDGSILGGLADDRRRYGRVRAWGSVGFVAAVLGGAWLVEIGVSPFWLATGVTGALALLSFALTKAPEEEEQPGILPALKALVSDRPVAALLVASAFHFAAISVYDGFFALHLESLGLASRWWGLAFGVGVTVEVLVLFAGPWILKRFGAQTCIVVAIALGIPRWLVCAWVQDPVVLVAVQALHGVGFGAFWIGAVHRVSTRAPRDVQASAQAVLAAALGGVGALMGNALGTLGVSTFENTGDIFLIAAALTVAGLVAACLGGGAD